MKFGDVLIRGSAQWGYEVVDAVTFKRVSETHASTLGARSSWPGYKAVGSLNRRSIIAVAPSAIRNPYSLCKCAAQWSTRSAGSKRVDDTCS
jgi:hypothetical protein